MRYLRLHSRFRHEPPELNITAFMNLMVILVPFLLMTMVFSHTTILELRLPGAGATQSNATPPALQLEITLRDSFLEVGDRARGLIRRIDNEDGSYDLRSLSGILQEIKARHPGVDQATLLLEPGIAYERLIQVMDQVRYARIRKEGIEEQVLLFPDISIGDAG